MTRAYGVDFAPTLVVIDPGGKIRSRLRGVTGEAELREAIDRCSRRE